MASRSAERVEDADDAVTRGTGNVFADLGYADADERQTKLRLANAVNRVVARQRLTQTLAAEKLAISQPRVSALANYKLDGFSLERLMTFLTALNHDVQILIRRKPRSRRRLVLPSSRRNASAHLVLYNIHAPVRPRHRSRTHGVMGLVPMSQTALGSAWLDRLGPDEREVAGRLIDEILLVGRDKMYRGLTGLLDSIMAARRDPTRPLALYAEREVPLHQGEAEPFFPGTGTGRAMGSGVAPVTVDARSQEVGSEGPVANLITSYARLHRGSVLSHPGPNAMRSRRVGPIVIVTDFIGSGKRVRDMLEAFARVATLQSWRSYGYVDFHVAAYSGAVAGLAHVRSSRLRPRLWTVAGCPTVREVFRGTELAAVLALCSRHPGREREPLGFRDTGALIAFAHGMPNNAPLILHSGRREWQPLFRNRSTLGADYEFPSDAAELLLARAASMLKVQAARDRLDDSINARWIKTMLVLATLERGASSAQRASAMSRVGVREVEEILGFTLIARWTSRRGTLSSLTALGRKELLRLRRRRSSTPALPSAASPFYFPTQLRGR